MGISALSSLCENAMITFKVNEVIRSLIIDGIFVGVEMCIRDRCKKLKNVCVFLLVAYINIEKK